MNRARRLNLSSGLLLRGALVAASVGVVLAPRPAHAEERSEAAVSPKEPTGEVAPPAEAGVDAPPADSPRADVARRGVWGRPARRGGFHLQVGFGVGGGTDTSGIFHTMELGYTLPKSGYTIALLHTFIQSKDVFRDEVGGPDLIGGWMVEFKAPLGFPDLVGKVALGLGGTHEQRPDGLIAHSGFGASYGFDLHFPIWERFGPTLTVAAIHATAQGEHHFGLGTALGVTLF